MNRPETDGRKPLTDTAVYLTSSDHKIGTFSDKELIEEISTFIADGVADQRVVQTLLLEPGQLIPDEHELWDYKVDLSGGDDQALRLGKTIKQIASFHNSYGGYLLYGVDDTGKIVGGCPVVDVDQIEKKYQAYTGQFIRLIDHRFSHSYEDQALDIQVVCIPKRLAKTPPVHFVRNGPADSSGRAIFKANDIYFRQRRDCVPCRRRLDYVRLFGDRLVEEHTFSSRKPHTSRPLPNSLPDRGQICSNLIGRDLILIELWRWLSDPWSYIKVLTGNGGNGKSSIAYEFALDVCREKPLEFDRVLWLTAKTKRYLGNAGRLDNVLETHFKDLATLVSALAERVAVIPEDIEGTSLSHQRNVLREGFEQFPCFVVIDDIDSLPSLGEQRELIDFVMQIASDKSRFLLTTRQDVMRTGDTYTIEVPGLQRLNFRKLFNKLLRDGEERLRLAKKSLKVSQVDRVRNALDGSPLYAEDFVRQLLHGMSLQQALAAWKKSAGDDVRRATLQKETDMLSIDAKRVLFVLALMGESSSTEIREVLGCGETAFSSSIDQLESLFLINAPRIADERRFVVKTNTALLILNSDEPFVQDANALRNNVKRFNTRNAGNGRRSITQIRKAIRQANSQERQGNPDGALRSIDETLKQHKDNRDLVLTRARILLSFDPPRYRPARESLRKSYELNQGKPELFNIWYDMENECNNPSQMILVASSAIDRLSEFATGEWYLKRAQAHIYMGANFHDSGSIECLRSFAKAKSDLEEARARVADRHDEHLIAEQMSKLCVFFRDTAKSFDDFEAALMGLDFWISIVGFAEHAALACRQCCENLEHLWRSTSNPSEKTCNLVDMHGNRILEVLARQRKVLDDGVHAEAMRRVSTVMDEAAQVSIDLLRTP